MFVQFRSGRRGKIRDVCEILCVVLGVWKGAFVAGTNCEEQSFCIHKWRKIERVTCQQLISDFKLTKNYRNFSRVRFFSMVEVLIKNLVYIFNHYFVFFLSG